MSTLDNTEAIIKKFQPVVESASLHELTVLNKMVVQRIRLMHKANTVVSLASFNIGDRVTWWGSDGVQRTGIIIRINQKTVSVKVSDEGFYWNVSPQLLKKDV